MEDFYKVGGAVRFDHPSYVVRKADSKLYELLKKGEYCYVFNSRQMGKSSLKARVSRRLRADGIRCASADLTQIGKHEPKDKWYQGFAIQLLDSLGLDVIGIKNSWWIEHKESPENQRLEKLFKTVIFKEITQNIVVFVDEIDSIIDVPFKDDFFSFIRACCNHGAENLDFNRLSFCLLGVATPTDLIQDKNLTPFNIGRSIELTPLTFNESKTSLVPGLSHIFNDPETALKSILDWTGGQPFLTQKFCELVAKHAKGESLNADEIAQKYIIQNWSSHDSPVHLGTILDRILSNSNRVIRLLGLYQEILRTGCIFADNSEDQNELCLTGLVVRQEGMLKVYNNIYATIFNSTWVEKELEKLRPYASKLQQWKDSGEQDEQALLQREELDEYSAWAEGKQLSNDDYRFLKASQQSALSEIQTLLNSAEVQLRKAKRGRRRALIGSFIFSALIIYSGFILNKENILKTLHRSSFFAREHNFYFIAAIANEFTISIQPEFVPAYYELGYTYSEMGKDDKAFYYLKTAVDRFKDKNAYSAFGRILIRRQEYTRAEKFILRALEEDKTSHYYQKVQLARLYQNLGWAQLEQKNEQKLEEAKKNLLKSISLDKQYATPYATPYCLLAKTSQKAKNRDQELKYWRFCLNFANPDYLDQKMWLKIAKKKG
jgi:tetratricopeptide (TPR) repeat protein